MADAKDRPVLVAAALAVGLAGLLWLGQESGWLSVDLPLGPLSVLLAGLALLLYAYHI